MAPLNSLITDYNWWRKKAEKKEKRMIPESLFEEYLRKHLYKVIRMQV